MIISDSPISNKNYDLLNRYEFSKRISDSIMSIDAKEGICLSIQGPWGSGKSSVINLMVDCIKTNYLASDYEILFFTPWNFVTTKDLFIQFFCMLADSFYDKKYDRDLKIAEELKKYIGLIDSFNPGLKVASLLATALNDSVSSRNPFDSSNLQKQRDKIVNLIKKQSRKIIVIIDELDRITDEEIRLVFQLVNSVAKFPNIIYLLAYDKNVVVNALTKSQSVDGEKYLEKIVQVPITLPEIKSKDIENILFDRLNYIIHQFDYSFDNDHWNDIYLYVIYEKFNNIREVVRFINSLYVKCTLVGKEINFIDLVAITFIEQRYKDLYEWIKENRKIITHSADHYNFNFRNESEYTDSIRKELKSINIDKFDEYKKILDVIFPNWDSKYSYNSDYFRKGQRIAHGDFVDRYFCFEVEEGALSKQQVSRFLFEESFDEMIIYFGLIKDKKDQVEYLLKDIRASINDLNDDRRVLVSKVLINTASVFDRERTEMFSLSSMSMNIALIEKLLERVKDKSLVGKFMLEAINSADINQLALIADIINTNELAHGRLAANGQKRTDCPMILTAEELEKCENAFVARIEKLIKTINILDFNDTIGLYIVLYLYKSFSEESFLQFLNEIKLNKLEVLKFIRIYASKSIGTNGVTWSFNDGFKKYFSYDEAKSAYDSCLIDKSLLALPDDSLTRIVVFELWYSVERNENDRIKSSDVDNRKAEILNAMLT